MKRLIILTILSYSISPAQINGIYNHTYPRIATFNITGRGIPEWHSRFDVVTVASDSNLAKSIKALNPNTYVLVTNDWNQGAMFRYALDNGQLNGWRCVSSTGASLHRDSSSHYYADITSNCQRLSGTVTMHPTGTVAIGTAAGLPHGETYSEALARCCTKYFPPYMVDGYGSDGTDPRPGWAPTASDVDLDRDGINDFSEHGENWMRQQWANGYNRTYQDIRSRWGTKNPLLYHNPLMAGQVVAETLGIRWSNGGLYELAPYPNGPTTFSAWKAGIDKWDSTGPAPRTNIWCFGGLSYGCGTKTDYRTLRWGLCTDLLTDAYFCMGEGRGVYYNEYWYYYYDEYDAPLGHPLSGVGGKAQQIGSTGVWVRFFDNGCSIVNESQTQKTVTDAQLQSLTGYAGPYCRFRGNQDTATNNGQWFSSITLNSTPPCAGNRGWYIGDGIVLLKTQKTVITPIIIDNVASGTTPGSLPATFTGSWIGENPSYPNNVYSVGAYTMAGTLQNYAYGATSATATATFTPKINASGKYKIYEWHGSHAGAATNALCYIYHADGVDSTHFINQNVNTGKWNLIGTYNFNSGGNNKVVITNKANGSVVADAIKFEYVPDTAIALPAAPNPLSPPKGSLNQPTTVILTWNKVNSATTYHFQISVDSLFSGVKYPWDSTLADTNVQLSGLSAGQKYFWHVGARNYNGASAYSAIYDFTTTVNTGSVIGMVYYDTNNNGIREPGEPGIPGWLIRLKGRLSDSVMTDMDGKYRFVRLPAGVYTVSEDSLFGWLQTSPSQPSQYTITITPNSTDFTCDFGNYSPNAVSTQISENWNTVSVPVLTHDLRKSKIFPSSSSSAYQYIGGYSAKDTLAYGIGYWLKFPRDMVVYIAGDQFTSDTTDVLKGWNLIGSISKPGFFLKTIPDSINHSTIWGFKGHYVVADTLLPGHGYWLKVDQPGKIIISSSAKTLGKAEQYFPAFDKLNSLAFSNAVGENETIYFSGTIGQSLVPFYLLPPIPPEECFDARFVSQNDQCESNIAFLNNNIKNSSEVRIRIQSAHYPIQVTCKIQPETTTDYVLQVNQKETYTLSSDNKLFIENPLPEHSDNFQTLILRIIPKFENNRPTSFDVIQNYPNPFNNTTIIRIAIPEEGTLRFYFYNTLGQEIAVLHDLYLKPGIHSIPFEGQGLTSGVYFYRVDLVTSSNNRFTIFNHLILQK